MIHNISNTSNVSSYEKPVDTSVDMVEKGIIPIGIPGGEMWKQAFLSSTNPYIQKLGEMMYIPTTWDDYYEVMPKW